MPDETRVIEPETMLSYSIPTAARLSDSSESHIRNLIENGFLSEKREEIIDLGISGRHNFKITRKGLTKITGHAFKDIDLVALSEQIIKIAKERGNL